jgi:thiomorpholine-carboxylate dehydrogenase
MPAVAPEAMGLKLVSYFLGNARKGMHTHFATIILNRASDGVPLATLDGTLITEMRTAAVSAAAARHLADPKSRVLAVIGSGVQARAHLEAMRHVFKFNDIRVASSSPESARRFAKAHKITACTSVEDAVRGADVIAVATAAKTPVLSGRWVKPGAFVAAVGAPRPNWREMDDALMQSATVIVDSRAAALVESGDVLLSGITPFAELGEVFLGKARPPADKTIVFKSLGMAVEDVATAKLVYDLLEKRKKAKRK